MAGNGTRKAVKENSDEVRQGSSFFPVILGPGELSSAIAGLSARSSAFGEQISHRMAPTVCMAIAKLQTVVADEPQPRSSAKRLLLLYMVPPWGGAVAFGATLMAAQAAGATVGISCASPVVSSLIGSMALCGASAVSAQVSDSLRKICDHNHRQKGDPFLSKDNLLLSAVSGLIMFKVLGGRCRNLMPSNIVSPGALARASIPARGHKYANDMEQRLIRELYRKHGCHHCGRRSGESIADHMPPNAVAHGRGWAKRGIAPPSTKFKFVLGRLASIIPLPGIAPKAIQQRFYPQCSDCTKIQSTALRHGKKSLVFHFKRGIPEGPFFAGFCVGAFRVDDFRPSTSNDQKCG